MQIALRVFICQLLFVMSAIGSSRSDSDFQAAINYYDAGEFAEACDTYEKIIIEGKATGSSYHNIASCYYRLGKIGMSMASLLKARELMPRDPDMKANLAFLKKRLQIIFQ